MTQQNGSAIFPDWCERKFEWAIEETDRLGQVLKVTTHALRALEGSARLAEVLRKNSDITKELGNLEDLAKKEVQADYPHLARLACVTLWAILEATIRDFVIEALCHDEVEKDLTRLTKIRLKATSVVPGKSQDNVARAIVDAFEYQSSSGDAQRGFDRARRLLEIIKVKPSLPGERERDLVAMQQVRHLIVHQHGRADNTFREACPWLDWTIGESIPLTITDARRWFVAVRLTLADVLDAFQVAHPHIIKYESVATTTEPGLPLKAQ